MTTLSFANRLLEIAIVLFATAFVSAVPAPAQPVMLPVPRVTIYPGQVIDGNMLVERAFRLNGDTTVTTSKEALLGKISRLTLLPGKPIAHTAVRAPHAVKQGQATLLVFKAGALTITGNAIALQSGGFGDVVSVRNPDSGRIVHGKIGADGSVYVGDQ